MGRIIVGVVVGYITMAAFVFLTFTLAYNLMGADGAFEPGTYEVSTGWMVASIVLGIIAAILGGFVCSLIARRAAANRALAVVVLVLGIAIAIPALVSSDEALSQVRTGEVSNTEAMQNAGQPGWMLILNPILGAVGVLAGGCLRQPRTIATPQA